MSCHASSKADGCKSNGRMKQSRVARGKMAVLHGATPDVVSRDPFPLSPRRLGISVGFLFNAVSRMLVVMGTRTSWCSAVSPALLCYHQPPGEPSSRSR